MNCKQLDDGDEMYKHNDKSNFLDPIAYARKGKKIFD